MLGVFNKIKDQGYRIIITSDMYLDSDFITQVLNKNGYSGFSNVYISGEINKSKAQGDLYDYIKDQEPGNSVFIHIGDNQVSDVENASSHGFTPVKYENADSAGSKFRPADMSYIIGSAYRGIINHRMYSGIDNYSEEYEYGYIYGGLFVYGYCNYIHNYCKTNDIDKIIFLARDGDILKEIYDRIFPGENTEYALWSRAIGVKLMAGTNRYDYFRRFLTHKANKDYTVYEILESMELGEYASKWFDKPDEIVFTSGMEKDVRKVLTEHFHEITDKYKKEDIAAKRVWEKRLDGCKRAVAVDIGWAGTGAISIKHLVENKWNIPCKIYGMLAGTNTVYNDEPNASEFYLADGILDSYLFSQSKNRDILKRHDPNRNMNVYWEILLSSEQKHFTGYDINENDEIVEKFDDEPIYEFGIKQVKTGIRDFCSDYSKLCRINGMFMDISGRDAAAPMLALLNGNDKYLKRINDKFNLKTEV